MRPPGIQFRPLHRCFRILSSPFRSPDSGPRRLRGGRWNVNWGTNARPHLGPYVRAAIELPSSHLEDDSCGLHPGLFLQQLR
jgi:hypothetical protein